MEPRITRLLYSLLNFLSHAIKLTTQKIPQPNFQVPHPPTGTSFLFFFFSRWLITPYRDNGHLTAQQRRFNTVLSWLRQKVERAIGLLKGRWRRLLSGFLGSKTGCSFHYLYLCTSHTFAYSMMIYMMTTLWMMTLTIIMMTVTIALEGQLNKKRTHLINIVCA